MDTAILAYLSARWARPSCITVALSGAPAPDVGYAQQVARSLGLSHYLHYFDDTELDESIRDTIRIMKSFDPMEIRNSAAVHVALKAGKRQGLSTMMTGDACDELFAGYSFLFGLSRKKLEDALKKLWANMRFSSEYLAKDLGVTARLPFLDPQVKSLAMGMDVKLKVGREKGRVFGKWIVRKAFEGIIPVELIWREKAPIEVGTGTATLPALFEARIPTTEFQKKQAGCLREDGVVIRSKEHLFYYQIYRDMLGVPHPADSGARTCPDCNSNVEGEASFCRICGAYPV
ncbi:MAG: asparagine synthase-related protein [Chloroflexota bacterium]